jgi:hypothetical protein
MNHRRAPHGFLPDRISTSLKKIRHIHLSIGRASNDNSCGKDRAMPTQDTYKLKEKYKPQKSEKMEAQSQY